MPRHPTPRPNRPPGSPPLPDAAPPSGSHRSEVDGSEVHGSGSSGSGSHRSGTSGAGPSRSRSAPSRRLTRAPAPSPSAEFAAAVRAVVEVARRRGLAVPVFRSPPGLPEVDRSLRRTASGTIVSVRLGARPIASIQADVVDGVVAANGLGGREAAGFRRAAWAVLGGPGAARPPQPSPAPVPSGPEADPGSVPDARVA